MTHRFKATNSGPSLFNAIAIGLGFNILQGKIKAFSKGAAPLLDAFAKQHPNFQPKKWNTLIEWLSYYNTPKDLEALLAPVLIQLHQEQQSEKDIESLLLGELINLVLKNRYKINNAQLWETFTHKELFPFLNTLPLVEKNKLLAKLKELLSNKKGLLSKEAIDALLKEQFDAQHLSSLIEVVKADKNVLYCNLSLNHLKGLSTVLNLKFIYWRTVKPKKADIVLKKDGFSWETYCEDSSITLLDTVSTAKTSQAPAVVAPTQEQLEEAQKERVILQVKNVDNPGQGNCAFYAFGIGLIYIIQYEKHLGKRDMFELWKRHHPSLNEDDYSGICRFDFNNQDTALLNKLQSTLRYIVYDYQVTALKKACAKAISFLLIGQLVELIQAEQKEARREMFDLLKAHIPSLTDEHYERILAFDPDPNRGNFDLFNELRELFGNDIYGIPQVRDILSNPQFKFKTQYCRPIETDLYNNFLIVFNGRDFQGGRIDPNYNEFARSIPIQRELATVNKREVRPGFESEQLAPVFLKLVYGEEVANQRIITDNTAPSPSSPILECMRNIRTNYIWGTHSHLNFLAEAFSVDLNTIENGQSRSVITARQYREGFGRNHSIMINNHGNFHWTTRFLVAQELNPSKMLSHHSGRHGSNIFQTVKSNDVTDEALIPRAKPRLPIEAPRSLAELQQSLNPAMIDNLTPQPVTPAQPEKKEPLLCAAKLNEEVRRAALQYIKYSQNIPFSIWHRHGETGRARAKKFATDFERYTHPNPESNSAMEANPAGELIKFLSDATNGNTHPHSFRTMLLHEVLEVDENRTLQEVSAHFETFLKYFAESIGEPIPSTSKYYGM